ncbi:MAG: GrpB family protein [Mycobacterium sp.]|nr:GrpB family protein [Mycobacterium sp.]
MELGLRYGDVAIVDSDPAWADTAADLIAQLGAVLGENVVAIEHVGSTAVPGMAAKPIIDLAVALSSKADKIHVTKAFHEAGYVYRSERSDVGDRLFHRQAGPDVCTVIVHVVPEGAPAWQDWLTVRDRLRSDPATAQEYAALKRQLARRFPTDRTAYSRGKAEFVAKLAARG